MLQFFVTQKIIISTKELCLFVLKPKIINFEKKKNVSFKITYLKIGGKFDGFETFFCKK